MRRCEEREDRRGRRGEKGHEMNHPAIVWYRGGERRERTHTLYVIVVYANREGCSSIHPPCLSHVSFVPSLRAPPSCLPFVPPTVRSFDEFKAFCIATPELRNVVTKGAPGVVLKKNIRAEFDKVDSDNSGNIDMKEFTQMLFGIMPELRRTPERVYVRARGIGVCAGVVGGVCVWSGGGG